MSDAEIAALSAGPGWTRLLAVADAIPNDWMLWQEEFAPREVAGLRTPTLMLLGSESPQWLSYGTKAIHAALPHAQLTMLPGQGHAAMIAAPQMFAQAVIDFAGRIGG
jgi:pimeloyl-ACP methyl ester carboxylesterase